MSVLDQLKLTAALPKKGSSSVERFRRRMTDAISLQIDIAKADAAGEAFNRLRQKWVRNATSGDKELRNVPIPIRRWWWTDVTGVTYMSVKQGSKLIELAPGKNAIEVGSLADLADKLALLRDAIRAGELDAQANPERQPRLLPKTTKPNGASSKGASAKA